jgi:hypothetical protein
MPDDVKSLTPSGAERETRLADALSERYLAYALSTITARSLPDVRDGLKPVHRRLLWAMRQLRLDPEAGFKKCARIVGDVVYSNLTIAPGGQIDGKFRHKSSKGAPTTARPTANVAKPAEPLILGAESKVI